MAADGAAWAVNKKRFDEVHDFVYAAKRTIFEAKEADFLTEEQADGMIETIREHTEAMARQDVEAMQESLATLGSQAVDVAFQKVVECETRER